MPHPWQLTFDLLTLKVVSQSRVAWATSVPILVFLGLSVLDLGPTYVTDTDRRQTDRRASLLNAHYSSRRYAAYIRHCELSWKFCTSFMLKMFVITTRHQNNDDMCMMSYRVALAKLCNGGYNIRFLHRYFLNL